MNSSLNSILNVARSAVFANQTGVRVTSQNIANAQSEGYSRRTVSFVENRPDITPVGRLGTGVRVHEVVRVRDELLDVTFRQETAKASGFELRHDVLGRVEQIFGEPSEEGLAASLDAFWNAWSDLASRPSNVTSRREVQLRGEHVASTLQSFDRRLGEVESHARIRLTETVRDVNGIAEQVAGLNREIVTAEAGGHEAHDLRDQRDRLLDGLAELGTVRVIDRGNGSVAVMVENAMLVDGKHFNRLTAAGEPPEVTMNGLPLSFQGESSRMGELVAALNSEVPAVRERLDQLASSLVEQVNAIHNQGFTAHGAAGDFFDPGTVAQPVTAATIRLHADVAAAPTRVATSDDGDETTNNRVALAMAALQGRPADNAVAQELVGEPAWSSLSSGLSGRSLGEYYEDIVTGTALQVSSAGHNRSVFGTIAQQADMRRQSVSGVSTDEELIRLMNFQQAYTAAAKVVTTVDEMLQTVLNMV